MREKRTSSAASVLLTLFRLLFTAFAILTMLFIFSNSLEIAALSSQRSGRVMAFLNEMLAKVSLGPLSEYAVRKLAHFCEYALLGFWYTLCLRVYTRHTVRYISWPLFLLLFVANVDETIQTFVSGRSGQLSDVWLDFCGGLSGTLCALVLICLITGFFRLLGFGRKRAA